MVDCQDLGSLYGDQLEKYAIVDYLYALKQDNKESSGALPCFCQSQLAAGVKKADLSEKVFTLEEFGFSEPICGEYFTFTFWSNSFAQSIKYFVLIFNIILRSGVIFIMSMVGYPTLSKEMQRVTIVTFLCYFFNTGFIVTLVAADCSEQPLLGSIIHGGDRGDFNQEFF